MIFKLIVNDDNLKKNLSWILCKNPNNVFSKSDKFQTTTGCFDEDGNYTVIVHNDYLNFLKKMKDLNLDTYVNLQYESVTPYNLRGLYECLRTATRGGNYNISFEMTKEFGITNDSIMGLVNTKSSEIGCIIGPVFIKNFEYFQELFGSFNMECGIEDVEDIVRGVPIETEFVKILKFKSTNITIKEFLQKIYILFMFFTFEQKLYRVEMSKIEKLMLLSKAWIKECSEEKILKKIIRRFCFSNKDLMKKFIDNIDELGEDESDELKSNLYIGYETLNTKRHKYILDILDNIFTNFMASNCETFDNGQVEDPKFSVIDYGCAEGTLIKKLDKHYGRTVMNVLGFDVKVKKYNKSVKEMNILYPNLDLLPEKVDILILTEVIEHFTKEDRIKLLSIIKNIIQPEYLIITVPNFDYNHNFGIEPGKYRHPDHKIEYTWDQYREEIIGFFLDVKKKEYSHTFFSMDIDGNSMDVTNFGEVPNFISLFKRNCITTNKYTNKFPKYYSPLYLPISNYTGRSHELSNGFSSKQFRLNVNAIPYLQPSISPVDYSEEYPGVLEHPLTAVKYYYDRGVTDLIWEEKMMGSNAQMILFKNEQIANYFGLKELIYVNSRNGFPFFREDEKDKLMLFYNDVKDKMVYDFYILNGEMMPWSYKAKGLIIDKFQAPGESFLLDAYLREDYKDQVLGRQFLKSLSNHSKEEELEYYMFDILGCGNVDFSGKRPKAIFINGKFINHDEKMKYLRPLRYYDYPYNGHKYFKLVRGGKIEFSQFDYKHSLVTNNITYYWEEYCKKGGEGFVIKPLNKLNYSSNGYLIPNCLKVRGVEYLRLIYGFKYLNEEVIDVLKKRGTKRKRIMNVQQTEVSNIILRCFLNRNNLERERHIAFFIGNENTKFYDIDKTL